jgi:hypothetical protein
MTVPLREEVAIIVPEALSCKYYTRDLCASIVLSRTGLMLALVSPLESNIKTLTLCGTFASGKAITVHSGVLFIAQAA